MFLNIFSTKTSDGLTLYGGLSTGKKRTKKILVHVHGMTDYFYEGKLPETLGDAAHANDMDFCAFNNRGMGIVSLIDDGWYGTAMEKFEECIYDIDAVLNTLEKKGYTQFILSGHSTGCQKITYYQAKNEKRKNKKNVRSLILLSPADDMNVQKKNLGKEFTKKVTEAKRLVETKKGDTILPESFRTPMFSAKRFYHLFKENSIEGNIYNYEKPLTWVKKIEIPLLAIFGSEEQYRVISPEKMLKKIAENTHNKKSKTSRITGADHSFHGKEKEVYLEVKNFLTTL